MKQSAEPWPSGIFILVPAFEAATPLASLLPQLGAALPKERICCIDDGSTDNTAGVCLEQGVRCIRHAKNRGKGAALATGFAELLGRGARAIVTMDADGQHAAADLGKFLDCFAAEPAIGICIGRRSFRPGLMPLPRIFSNFTTSRLMSLICGAPILDSQCGYRLYSAAFLRSITISCSGFAAESEVILKAAHLGFPIRFVPVQTLYFRGPSHISHVSDTLRWLRAVVEIRRALKKPDRSRA